MNSRQLILIAIITWAFSEGRAQEIGLKLTLQQVVQTAYEQSLQIKVAQTTYENKYWQFRSYKSNYRPQLMLNSTLPNIDRSINPITQPDGTQTFIAQSNMRNSLDLSLNQSIPWTGGNVFVSSSLQRLDVFAPTQLSSYLASPAFIGFRQPIFKFNKLRWDRKIEPVKFSEAQRALTEAIEQVSIDATRLFFDLLIAQISLEISTKNEANNDTLYQITTGRYNLGKVAENELLQMELSLMNSKKAVTEAEMDIQMAEVALRTMLNLKTGGKITLNQPLKIPDFDIDEQAALKYALENRETALSFERRVIQAKRDLAVAKGERGFGLDFFALYGLTGSTNSIETVYSNLSDQQQVQLTIQVPVLDWGRAKSRMKTALANLELVKLQVEQDRLQFEKEVQLLCRNFEMNREALKIAIKADEIAQRRYMVTVNRYKIGKVVLLDLNSALKEKDEAKRRFLSALRDFWITYYELRKQTHYDFEADQLINYQYEVN